MTDESCTISTPHGHTCPSCRTRFQLPQYAIRDQFGPWNISHGAYVWLINAARIWDEISEEDYPASEFVAWLKFELSGERPFIYDFDGAKPRTGAGTPTNNRIGKEVHRHPDPLPFAGWKPVQK